MTYKIAAYLRLSKEEYSNEKELKDLNRIVTMYLDYAEFQAENHNAMSMKDWVEKLNAFLQFNGKEILPSEKEFAYKMKLEALTHQGKRTDLTSAQLGEKLESKYSVQLLAEEVGDSRSQIQRFIRLTALILELLDLVDEKQIALSPAVELSFLKDEEQYAVLDCIECNVATPSHAQAIRLKKMSQEETLTTDEIEDILSEEKPNQIPKMKFNADRIRNVLPKTVDITLVGQKRHIFLAKQSSSKGVSVDLTGLKPGNHKVTLKYSQKLKSLNYKLDPSQVTVTIYNKESDTRSLTYDLLHQDSLDSKLYIDNVELDRTDVIVKDAKYKLDKVATVKALIDVTKFPNAKNFNAGTFSLKDVPLVAYDTNGKIIDVEIVPKTVSAKITITSPSKEVPIKIVPSGKVAFGKAIKSIDSSISSAVVYGDADAVNKIQQLEVEIDVKDLKNDKEYNVTLKKPSGITDLSVNTVKINVTIDNSITKEFNNISVSAENLASGIKAQAMSLEDSKITVIVEGSEDVINNLDPTAIKAYVDLKNTGVGEHEVEVNVTGSDLKLTYKTKTKKVKIKITQE